MKTKVSSDKIVAMAALSGNINHDVIKRMIMFITEKTTNSNIICGLLTGLVVNAKVVNNDNLIKLLNKHLDERVCKITDLEVIICEQDIRITYTCKRFAKKADETSIYNTKRKQDDVYVEEVEVKDSYRIDINDFDFEDSVEFEVV